MWWMEISSSPHPGLSSATSRHSSGSNGSCQRTTSTSTRRRGSTAGNRKLCEMTWSVSGGELYPAFKSSLEYDISRYKCLSPSKGRPKPKVSEDLLQKLTNYFKKDNELFFSLLGKRFNWNEKPWIVCLYCIVVSVCKWLLGCNITFSYTLFHFFQDHIIKYLYAYFII